MDAFVRAHTTQKQKSSDSRAETRSRASPNALRARTKATLFLIAFTRLLITTERVQPSRHLAVGDVSMYAVVAVRVLPKVRLRRQVVTVAADAREAQEDPILGILPARLPGALQLRVV